MNIVEQIINNEIRNSRTDAYDRAINELESYFYCYAVGELTDLLIDLIVYARSIIWYMRDPEISYEDYCAAQNDYNEALKEIKQLVGEES